MQLAGVRVLVGVGGVAAAQGAAEVAGADGVELVGQLVRRGAGLDQGEGAAGVLEHVGVGGEVVAAAARTGSPSSSATSLERTQRLRYQRRVAVLEADAVDHPRAEEPVVVLPGVVQRVRPDPQVAAVEVVGEARR